MILCNLLEALDG